jgi:hypothetical protein
VEKLAAALVHAFVGVGAEVVALGLEEIGWQDGGAVAVEEREGGREGGEGDTAICRRVLTELNLINVKKLASRYGISSLNP